MRYAVDKLLFITFVCSRLRRLPDFLFE